MRVEKNPQKDAKDERVKEEKNEKAQNDVKTKPNIQFTYFFSAKAETLENMKMWPRAMARAENGWLKNYVFLIDSLVLSI